MKKKQEGLLVGVANTIGSAIGTVAAKADHLMESVKAERSKKLRRQSRAKKSPAAAARHSRATSKKTSRKKMHSVRSTRQRSAGSIHHGR